MFYSASTNGFYSSDVHGDAIPRDAAPITAEEYRKLLTGQSAGLLIVADEVGVPRLVDPKLCNRTAYLSQEISARRFRAENGGLDTLGLGIETSRDARSALTAIAQVAMTNPDLFCKWKSKTGFVELSSQQILALFKAVVAHVQACFDREAELLAHLEAGTYEDSMLDQGWPA